MGQSWPPREAKRFGTGKHAQCESEMKGKLQAKKTGQRANSEINMIAMQKTLRKLVETEKLKERNIQYKG